MKFLKAMQNIDWTNLVYNPDADFPCEVIVSHVVPLAAVVTVQWRLGNNPTWAALEHTVIVELLDDKGQGIRRFEMTDIVSLMEPLVEMGFFERSLHEQRMIIVEVLTYSSLKISVRDWERAITQNPVENTLVWGDPAEA